MCVAAYLRARAAAFSISTGRSMHISPWIGGLAMAALVSAAAALVWHDANRDRLPDGIVKTNGRLEAEQVEIATKLAGRLVSVLVEEGQTVEAGAVIARLDAAEIEAQHRSAEAQLRRAEQVLRESKAAVALRTSERDFAQREFERVTELHRQGFAPTDRLEQRRTQRDTAEAARHAALAQRDQAVAVIDAARAELARLTAVLADTTLTAPRRGRVQYKLAHAGEVLGAGARVVTLLDLSDVYMTIFLPARDAGRLRLGDEARLVFDAAPQYVVPAKVTFVATEAQFTPKTVETREEREKLMFRVKLSIAPDLLARYEALVKSGVRGMAWLRTNREAQWPASLAVKLP
jgi:HlyD family secretion protein